MASTQIGLGLNFLHLSSLIEHNCNINIKVLRSNENKNVDAYSACTKKIQKIFSANNVFEWAKRMQIKYSDP